MDNDRVGCFCVCHIGKSAIALLLHGVGSGLVGIFIAILIRSVQVVGFGDHEGGFLEIAVQAPPQRRMVSVACGGIFGALAWYYLRGLKTRIVSVEACLKGEKMPPAVTLANAMIQDIVVALGGSFGREAAPREIAAMWAGVLSDKLGIPPEERKVLVACGTGAGLAAVYSVPISGALYTIEHVLKWDVSWKTVIPASVTSALATIVASVVVDSNGLYSMKRYSYSWPSKSLLVWSAMIGPIAGLAAVVFRRMIKWVEAHKPMHRNPVAFQDTHDGQHVQLLLPDEETKTPTRKNATIIQGSRIKDGSAKSPTVLDVVMEDSCVHEEAVQQIRKRILVRIEGESEEREFCQNQWVKMSPEGEKDWHILIAMPTSFLLLGILSQDFPTLLGNGRALGLVAIHRQRTLGFFIMLLFLKVAVTVAAIGSGASGGTLTPSVALGATLGAILGESYQYALPDWAPPEIDDAPMSVIAAAAFLGISMTSPVTAVWLLLEFSAQAVDRNDLLLLLRGDPSGLIRSKLALGMIIPMSIATGGAWLVVGYADVLWRRIKPRERRHRRKSPSPESYGFQHQRDGARKRTRDHTRSQDLDLPPYEDDDSFISLSDHQSTVCSWCFRGGLLLNTGMTVFAGSAVLRCPNVITIVSIIGVFLSALFGAGCWLSYVVYAPERGYSELSSPTPESAAFAKEDAFGRGQSVQLFVGGCLAVVCAIIGAWTPLAPWALTVWTHEGAELSGLNASAASGVAVSACFAAYNLDLSHKASLRSIMRQTLLALLTTIAAGLAGYFCATYIPGFEGALFCHASGIEALTNHTSGNHTFES